MLAERALARAAPLHARGRARAAQALAAAQLRRRAAEVAAARDAARARRHCEKPVAAHTFLRMDELVKAVRGSAEYRGVVDIITEGIRAQQKLHAATQAADLLYKQSAPYGLLLAECRRQVKSEHPGWKKARVEEESGKRASALVPFGY